MWFLHIPDHDASAVGREVLLGHAKKELLRRRIASAGEPARGHYLAVPMTVFNGTEDVQRGVAVLWPTVGPDGSLTGTWLSRGCAYASQWARGKISVQLMASGLKYDFQRDHGGSRLDLELAAKNWGWSFFMSPKDGSWRPLTVEPSWFDVAMPKLEESELDGRVALPANSTTLESLLGAALQKQGMMGPNETPIIMTEHILATLLVDSISRAPSHITANYSALLEPGLSKSWSWSQLRKYVVAGNPKTQFPKPSDFATLLTVRAYFHGYVMAASAWFDYFSIVLLLSHALMALIFTLWVVIVRPTTSDAWETIPEMLALAQNSPAPEGDTLANTCAGIRKWDTPAVMVWVEEADSTGSAPRKDELWLTFRNTAGNAQEGLNKCQIDKAYGKA